MTAPLEPVIRTTELPWIPTGGGKSFRPLRFEPGGQSELMRLEPGAVVARHRHTGAVEAFQLEGAREMEDGTVIAAGDYHREPAGTIDAWRAAGSAPSVVYLRIEGDVEYLDDHGHVIGRANSDSQAAVYRAWCRQQGTEEQKKAGAGAAPETGSRL